MVRISLTDVYLQSRTRRWLQALRYASTILSQGVQMMEYFAAHAHVPGARQISARDKRVTALLPTDQIRMTLESQPLVPGSWLAAALSDVTTALDNIDYGDGFVASIAALSEAIEKAIPVLEERVIEPDETVDEIVADLERSLFISIVAPLTAHNPTCRWWTNGRTSINVICREMFPQISVTTSPSLRSAASTNLGRGVSTCSIWCQLATPA